MSDIFSDNTKYMLCKIMTFISIILIVILAFEMLVYAINKIYNYYYDYTWIYKGLKYGDSSEIISINDENAALVKSSLSNMIPFIYSKPPSYTDN